MARKLKWWEWGLLLGGGYLVITKLMKPTVSVPDAITIKTSDGSGGGGEVIIGIPKLTTSSKMPSDTWWTDETSGA